MTTAKTTTKTETKTKLQKLIDEVDWANSSRRKTLGCMNGVVPNTAVSGSITQSLQGLLNAFCILQKALPADKRKDVYNALFSCYTEKYKVQPIKDLGTVTQTSLRKMFKSTDMDGNKIDSARIISASKATLQIVNAILDNTK